MFSRNSGLNMDSDPPEHFLYHSLNKKKFPATLWSLVNDPANDSVLWDSSGEAVTINQRLFEKEVLSQGCGLPDTFKSFHRQLNLYSFKNIRGNGLKMGCRHFQNPNFKRGHPELIQQLTRNTVKKRLKCVGHKRPYHHPYKNEKFLQDGKGIASLVPRKIPIIVNPKAASLPYFSGAPRKELRVYLTRYVPPVLHQQRSFSQTVLYQAHPVIQAGVVASIKNGEIDVNVVFQKADELMPLPSPYNVQPVSLETEPAWTTDQTSLIELNCYSFTPGCELIVHV